MSTIMVMLTIIMRPILAAVFVRIHYRAYLGLVPAHGLGKEELSFPLKGG